MDVFAAELNAFIKDHELNKPMIFGYSMCGYVALHLEDTQPGTFSKITKLGTKFGWNPDTAKHEVSKLNPDLIMQKVPVFAQMLETRHADWQKLMTATARMMLGLGEKLVLTPNILATIKTPVTIMRGDQDQMVSKEESVQTAAAISGSQFIELAETPHPIEKVTPQVLLKQLCS